MMTGTYNPINIDNNNNNVSANHSDNNDPDDSQRSLHTRCAPPYLDDYMLQFSFQQKETKNFFDIMFIMCIISTVQHPTALPITHIQSH